MGERRSKVPLLLIELCPEKFLVFLGISLHSENGPGVLEGLFKYFLINLANFFVLTILINLIEESLSLLRVGTAHYKRLENIN